MNLHHYYHIYADGQWREPVSEHIKALKEYGLLDALKTFAIGMVGSSGNCADVVDYLAKESICYHLADTQPDGWEQVTQIKMWEFSKDNDGLMLYAHSKGASDWNEVNVRWRRSMLYWHVVRWKDCVEKLKECDAVATHWIYPTIQMPEHVYGNPMSAGNFFWTKCDLMRTWMEPPLGHRHNAEGWIGYKYVQKPWPIWDWTPYFPNSNHFADGWIDNPNFIGVDTGIIVPPIVLHNKQVPL